MHQTNGNVHLQTGCARALGAWRLPLVATERPVRSAVAARCVLQLNTGGRGCEWLLHRGCSAARRHWGVARCAAEFRMKCRLRCRCARDVDMPCALQHGALAASLAVQLPSRPRVGRSNAACGASAAQCDCGACLFFPKEVISHRNKTKRLCWSSDVNWSG
jgi:hypothetical protein